MLDSIPRDGREIAVIGLGRSGLAAIRLLRAAGLPVYGSDQEDSTELERATVALRDQGAVIQLGGHDLDRIRRAALVILSPGVPPNAAPVAAARTASVPVRAEADLGLEALDGVLYIAVTGTNGKTTTTALVAHLLRGTGRRAVAAGNIGTALSEVALAAPRPEWLAVELSSFQLHDAPNVRPAVGILTNLAPDHLDRYAALEEYYADKARLFANATAESVWVVNGDDRDSAKVIAGVPGRVQRFSLVGPAEGWYDRDRQWLMLGAEPLLERRRFPLLGDHNVANALAAALAVAAVGGTVPEMAEALTRFAALPHRMEPVGELDGVVWINDSKATNVSSTEMAVAAVGRPFVLLLGGRHKGEPYTRLAPYLRDRCRAVIAYGEAAPIVVKDLTGTVPVIEGGDFADVLTRARLLARPGDAVLLSPACSSYDMFNNYEERGQRFRQFVEEQQ